VPGTETRSTGSVSGIASWALETAGGA